MKTNKEAGFTLIELLVVLAIIAIFSSVVVVSAISRKESEREVEYSLELLAADIRLAREYAGSGRTVQFPGHLDVRVPPGGFGVFFALNTQRVIVFANATDDTTYDANDDVIISRRGFSDVAKVAKITKRYSDQTWERVSGNSFQFVFEPITRTMKIHEDGLHPSPIVAVEFEAQSLNDQAVKKHLNVLTATQTMVVGE